MHKKYSVEYFVLHLKCVKELRFLNHSKQINISFIFKKVDYFAAVQRLEPIKQA